MAGIFDIFGGGSSGGGTGGFGDYLEWLREERKRQEALEGREKESAEAFTQMRMSEIRDRTGFAGLVNVGEAVQASDERLYAELQSAGGERLENYLAALESERTVKEDYRRTITGEKYEAEDALQELRDRLSDILPSAQQEGFTELGDIESALAEFQTTYEFSDIGDFEDLIEAKRLALEEYEPRRMRDDTEFGVHD